MGFQVVYVADGELTKVKKVNRVEYLADGELSLVKQVDYIDRIRNFAYLSQPYNKMRMMNVPAIEGVYTLNYTSPNYDTEILSIVVTCSGYGEDDYFNLWVNGELWFDTWFPTEVKEGLYIGTSTYVYKCGPNTPFVLKFVNKSGTSKKVWVGFRFLKEKSEADNMEVEPVDTTSIEGYEPIEAADILDT